MTTEKKAFDCVVFKHKAQRRLLEEYESRRGEFNDYAEFIRAKSKENHRLKWIYDKFQGNA